MTDQIKAAAGWFGRFSERIVAALVLCLIGQLAFIWAEVARLGPLVEKASGSVESVTADVREIDSELIRRGEILRVVDESLRSTAVLLSELDRRVDHVDVEIAQLQAKR